MMHVSFLNGLVGACLRRENFDEYVKATEKHRLHVIQCIGEVDHRRNENNDIHEGNAHIDG